MFLGFSLCFKRILFLLGINRLLSAEWEMLVDGCLFDTGSMHCVSLNLSSSNISHEFNFTTDTICPNS